MAMTSRTAARFLQDGTACRHGSSNNRSNHSGNGDSGLPSGDILLLFESWEINVELIIRYLHGGVSILVAHLLNI